MNNRTRREFLEDSMFAAAGAVAVGSSGILTGEALLADEKQSSSPNERLNVAVVGVKGRGGSHIGAFAGRKDTMVRYICDTDREIGMRRVAEVAKRQGETPKFVEDLREVCDDKTVDIVSVATPNHWHSLAAVWAIQAGKDVYLEKPVSHNVWEGGQVVKAARRHKKICQTGTQSRSNPGMIAAMKYMHEGKIGEVKLARGLCYKPRGSIGERGEYSVPSSVNYDIWLGPAPMAPLTRRQFHYDWHWQWPYGNGDLGNQGIHQMDLARWGLGLKGLSQGVLSYGGRFSYVDAGDTANTQVVAHDFGEKSLVFEVRGLKTQAYRGAKIGVIFEGTDGYVVIPSYHSGAAFDRSGKKIDEFGGEADHFGNFLKAVRSRNHEDLNADIEKGHYSSALCHLGNISYRLGEQMTADQAEKSLAMLKTTDNAVKTLERTMAHLRDNGVNLAKANLTMGPYLAFNPQSETFRPGQQEDKLIAKATKMLRREYRKPFVVPEVV